MDINRDIKKLYDNWNLIYFFGFGSLINKESLISTVNEVWVIKPCYIKWYFRDFSVWDPLGFTKTQSDVLNLPFCALDVKKSSNKSSRVNWVLFSITKKYFDDLLSREQEYSLLKTEVYDFNNELNIWSVYFFSSNKNNWEYSFNSKSQDRYLKICLDWAKSFGKVFYNNFLNTTFIWDKKLNEVEKIKHLL